MNIASIIRQKGRSVVTCHEDLPLSEVVRKLTEDNIGALVVTGADGAISGIISERDVVHALNSGGADALSRPAADYMTRDVITCTEHDTVVQVMTVMTQHRFRHLPVVTEGRLAGIVSIGDVVKQRIAEAESEAEAMRNYIATA